MARIDLRRVAKARRKLEAATAERDSMIYAAYLSGETQRDIAKVAGLSQQRVSQIVENMQSSS